MSVAGLVVGVGVAGAALVAVGWDVGGTHRVHDRVRVLGRTCRPAGHARGPGHSSVRRLVVAVVSALRTFGSVTRRVMRRPPDPARDLPVGTALAVGLLVALLLGPGFGGATGAVVIAWWWWHERRQPRRREAEIRAVLPDVVDLFRLAVGAGLSVHEALEVVAPRALEPVGGSLQEVRRRVGLGERLGDSLGAMDDLGDAARSLQSALTAAARYGAPLSAALDRVVVDARMLRRRRAEEQARKLPVKLLFPLVMCVLPAFGLLAVVPLLAGSLPSLTSGA